MIVVDSNVIFALFLSSSFTRELAVKLAEKGIKLISPVHALNEISKYRNEIMSKFLLDEEEFEECLQFITLLIEFVEEKEIMLYLKDAQKISPDPKDAPFFALALKFSCPIWSNDKRLKKQDKVLVLSTEEIARLFL